RRHCETEERKEHAGRGHDRARVQVCGRNPGVSIGRGCNRPRTSGIRAFMSAESLQVRLAGQGDRDAVLALLTAQLREHDIATPQAEVAHAIDGMLRHPGRGRILVATAGGPPIGVAWLSSTWTLEHGGRSMWLE